MILDCFEQHAAANQLKSRQSGFLICTPIEIQRRFLLDGHIRPIQ